MASIGAYRFRRPRRRRRRRVDKSMIEFDYTPVSEPLSGPLFPLSNKKERTVRGRRRKNAAAAAVSAAVSWNGKQRGTGMMKRRAKRREREREKYTPRILLLHSLSMAADFVEHFGHVSKKELASPLSLASSSFYLRDSRDVIQFYLCTFFSPGMRGLASPRIPSTQPQTDWQIK